MDCRAGAGAPATDSCTSERNVAARVARLRGVAACDFEMRRMASLHCRALSQSIGPGTPRIGNLNIPFHSPQLYRRPGKRSIARCSMKTPLSRWPFSPFTGPHRLWPTPFDRFARARGGARAGKPRCVSILTITAGSSIAAMSFNSQPHCRQGSRSIPNRTAERQHSGNASV